MVGDGGIQNDTHGALTFRVLGKTDGPDPFGGPTADTAEDRHISRLDERFTDCLLRCKGVDCKNGVGIAVAYDGKIRGEQKRFDPPAVYHDPAGLIHGFGRFQDLMPQTALNRGSTVFDRR